MLKAFCQQYTPTYQRQISNKPDYCFFADFPTLAKVREMMGINAPVVWLVPQLLDLSEFCGCKNKLTVRQLEECASMIVSEFYFLKVSELMLFFARFKAGHYGVFYGAVDPMTIMCKLRYFIRDERNAAYVMRENEERERKELEEKKKYEECLVNREQLRKEFKNLSAGWFK